MMVSCTKNIQSKDNIELMVKDAFGINPVAIDELKDGFFNVAYRIVLEDKREVILKIAPPSEVPVMAYEKNLMDAEVKSLRIIKAIEKVPVPEVLYYSKDDKVSKNQLCDSPYFFMTKLDGVPYNQIKKSLSEEEQYQIEYDLGRYNRIMNDVTGEYFGYFPSLEDKCTDWKSKFLDMIDGVIKDGKARNVDIGVDYEIIEQIIKENSYSLVSITKPHLIHWDLWDGNVFIKDKKISGIIDFERAVWGDPLMEYAFRSHNEHMHGYHNGYGQIEREGEAYQRLLLYDIYLYLILIIECDYRNYPDTWQYDWGRSLLLDTVKKFHI